MLLFIDKSGGECLTAKRTFRNGHVSVRCRPRRSVFFGADKCFGVLGAKPLGERVAKDGAFARGKPPPLA